jgi:Cu/Ag efflux protein CusF
MELLKRRSLLKGLVAGAAGLCALAPIMSAQPKGKKEYVFKGKVESVNASTKKIVVANEKVEGWMEPMTMAYAVDKADDVLKKVKAGDQITAKVYDGSSVLYDVQVVPPAAKK